MDADRRGSDPEVALRARFGGAVHADVSAAGTSGGSSGTTAGTTYYAGTVDGKLLASHDGGTTWNEAPRIAAESIARIWVDRDRSDVALAAAGTHLYRTVNGGLFWDEVTGALPSGQDPRRIAADPIGPG